jgi:hypothetical protein
MAKRKTAKKAVRKGAAVPTPEPTHALSGEALRGSSRNPTMSGGR